MIPLLWLRSLLAAYWRPIAGVTLVCVGVWAIHHHGYNKGEAHGRAAVEALWQADKQAAADAYAKAQAATQAVIDADRKAAQETESALLAKLRDADTAGRTLAGRLRDYQARRCGGAVSAAAGPAAGPAGAAAEPGDGRGVDEALEAHLAACAADATRLAGFQEWWQAVAGNR